ncbi:hypothetical protein SAMN04515674_106150 [Pseudarcicella hirudinis]|uniref:Uncharacterized protein n=1 Tax=Pseudarcicella hirudinis TaxID=1079859 RepID=A0A1I5TQC7_9BACT|nr:hypothetical protein [Pseudarcicella hirudinis]SFP85188.1 hypothetical protein SAMN04515674_106150 [Pseudarcicella hirudinis]
MDNITLKSVNLEEISFAEATQINGGQTPSTKTIVTAIVVGVVFGPIGELAFWGGYLVNS